MMVLIDNYDSFTYNLYQALRLYHPKVRVLRHDQASVSAIKALHPSGIILSPGPGRPENAGICVDLVQSLAMTTPVLGVCLGLQAIVVAFGGRVIQAPEIVHGKPEYVFHHQRGLYQGMPLPFQAGRYHSLMAERDSLPAVLQIEAESSSGLIMGIRHRSAALFGVQFHPESILTPKGSQLIKNFVDHCEQKQGALCA
ncbi:MAG: aminodeoxychorismate/anthranilate synthase component II [Gammaproteobacteria bacterium]|nr:aminodeoxychorismate/anthranilate synthase component II [Gammaproteobacteria bacterium]